MKTRGFPYSRLFAFEEIAKAHLGVIEDLEDGEQNQVVII
jgi:hypothetical protein